MRDHHDPIEGAKAELIKRGVSEDKLKEIDKKIRQIVTGIRRFRRKLARAGAV
jgi:pyruvate dehydrogenase E1 component alpha subunit